MRFDTVLISAFSAAALAAPQVGAGAPELAEPSQPVPTASVPPGVWKRESPTGPHGSKQTNGAKHVARQDDGQFPPEPEAPSPSELPSFSELPSLSELPSASEIPSASELPSVSELPSASEPSQPVPTPTWTPPFNGWEGEAVPVPHGIKPSNGAHEGKGNHAHQE